MGSSDEMYRLIFQMLFWLGCRIGEVLALTSSDIDLESSNRKITIPKFLQGEIKEYLDRQ